LSFTASLEAIVLANRSGLLAKHDSWERVRLAEVAQVLNGFPFPSSGFTRERGVPLLRIRDVLKANTEAYWSGQLDDTYLVEPGELVVGMDGDFNSALWAGPSALLNQRVCKVTPDERYYNRRLLSYVLPAYLSAINHETSSITVKHLSSRTVEDIPLPLPPREEQNRIVAELEKQLTRLDSAMKSLRQVARQLDVLRAAILAEAVDVDWPTSPLGDVAKTSSGGTPSRRRPEYYGGPIPWVKSGELRDGRVTRTEESITQLGLTNSSAKLVKPGTLLVALYGATVGKLAVLDIEAATNQAVCAIEPDSSLLMPYLRLVLRHKRPEIIRSGQGGAQPNISQAILRKLRVPIPPKDRQEIIVSHIETRLSIVDTIAASLQNQLSRAGRTRQSILQRAFTGRLVSQDPEDEPASELLERLQHERSEVSAIKSRRPNHRKGDRQLPLVEAASS
jgi:type I restriction enzyme S subunit